MLAQDKQGYVTMDCTITTLGRTRDCVVTQATNRDFARAAQTYEASARYHPAMQDGVPIEVAHHIVQINFALPATVARLAYDCTITAAGQATNCRDESPSGPFPPALRNVVLDKRQTLPVAAPRKNGQAVEEAHRKIEVLLTVQPSPVRNDWIPALPSQIQVNLLLDCNPHAVPECREIAEPPPFEDIPSEGHDEITGISMGFNGILPDRTAAVN